MTKLQSWMKTISKHNSRSHGEHVTDEAILLLLDGEGKDSGRREVQEHLESCWNCRFRSDELRQTIHHVVEYRQSVLVHRLPIDPPSGRSLLASRLEEQNREIGRGRKGNLLAALMNQFTSLSRHGVATSMIVLSTVMLGVVVMVTTRHGAAREDGSSLLLQAVQAEERVSTQPGVVIHQTLLFQQSDGITHASTAVRKIDVWQEGKGLGARRVYTGARVLSDASWTRPGTKRVEYHAPAESSQGNSQIAGRPIWDVRLSAEDFAKLEQRPSNLSLETSSSAYLLRYRESEAGAHPRLLMASLSLQRANLHATEERIHVEDEAGNRDYRLTETSYEALPATEVDKRVFDVDSGIESSTASVVSLPRVLKETPASLESAMEALAILDGAGELVRQDVGLQKTAGGALEVRGVVPDEVRKQALLQLFAGDHTRSTIRLDITSATEVHAPIRRRSKEVQIISSDGLSPEEPFLRAYLSDVRRVAPDQLDQQAAQFANDILAVAEDAASQAAAIQTILRTVPAEEADGLSAVNRREWRNLVQGHSAKALDDLTDVRRRVALLEPEPDGGTSSSTGGPSADVAEEELRRSTGQMQQMLEQSFAVRSGETAKPMIQSSEFWKTLRAAEHAGQAIQRATRE